MQVALREIVTELNYLRQMENPVEVAWNMGCNHLGLALHDPWREWGHKFAHHPDLKHSSLTYHNHFHSAEAVLCAAWLGVAEFGIESIYPGMLMFAMLCHDIAHTGKHNEYDYHLEAQAVASMRTFLNEDMKNYWEHNLRKRYGEIERFLDEIETIILGTDFKNGPKHNQQNYRQAENSENYPLYQLCMLANEADILPSVIIATGVQRGQWLAQETGNPGLATWQGRVYFLRELATFESRASRVLSVPEHIVEQLHVIDSLGVEFLDSVSAQKGWAYSHALVMEKIPLESLAEKQSRFNL